MPSEVYTPLFTPMLRSDEAPTVMSSISPLTSLPPEARNHIFEFLPKKDALVLCRVCSQWNAHVRHSRALWEGELERYPITFERLQAELAAKTAAAGGYLTYGEGVDYIHELAQLKPIRYSSITSETRTRSQKSNSLWPGFSCCCCCSKQDDNRVFMLGLDGAGKTDILFYWILSIPKLGPSVSTDRQPNVGIIDRDNRELVLWDVGGMSHLRPLWSTYLTAAHEKHQSIIFVIDGSDDSRLGEATQALVDVLKITQPRTPLLVLVNKLDLAQSMSIERVHFELRSLLVDSSRPWCVQGCSAVNLRGVDEGLDWICAQTHQ